MTRIQSTINIILIEIWKLEIAVQVVQNSIQA